MTYHHHALSYHDFYALALCASAQEHVFWADSASFSGGYGRYSFVACDPITVIDDFNDINNHLSQMTAPSFIPFMGGFAGYISYDYALSFLELDTVGDDIINLPLMAGGIYDRVLYADHQNQTAGIVTLPIHPTDTPQQRIDSLLSLKPPYPIFSDIHLKEITSKNEYMHHVDQIRNHIQDGAIFQANIARYYHGSASEDFDPLTLYRLLRKNNPAPFGCFLKGKEYAIMSSSPERFLNVADDIIETRPIKGTLSSIYPPEELLNNEKDYAENIMITDMLRNDLARASIVGSVHVPSLCKVESFEGLHHLVTTIKGQKDPALSLIDILAYSLPGGSITGAPKKHACELIMQTEKIKRNAYCGISGYIGFNQEMDMNILIRTLLYDTKTLSFAAGCGITFDSNPEAEYQESCLKADKILKTIKDYNDHRTDDL